MPTGCSASEPYQWIAHLSRAFRLECFVFVSGYIFTFQMLTKKKFPRFNELLSSKVVRLLIPCWIFSIIYFICFKHYENFLGFVSTILGGAGHLWYLPCLFICFLIQWVLLNKKKDSRWILAILSFLVFVSFVPLPLNMNQPLYYMLFFYMGGLFYQNKEKLEDNSNAQKVVMAWIFFLFCLIGINIFLNHQNSIKIQHIVIRGLSYGIDRILKAILAIIGIYAFYISAVIWCRKHEVKEWALNIGLCGYGVYVFHQFVLVWLYDYTQLPISLGTYILPWTGFLMATAISLVLTILIRKTKIGRRFL